MTHQAARPRFLDQLGDELRRVAERETTRSHGATRRHRVRTGVAAVAATLALAAGAGAATGTLHLPGGGGPDFVARETTGHFGSALTGELSVLDRARTPADAMGNAAAYVTGPDSPAPGSSLRVVPGGPASATPHASATSLPVWLLPTESGDVNVQALPPGATGTAGFSADTSALDKGWARMTVDDDLIGLAPDAVRTVTVTLESGVQVKLRVVDNVYGAHFDAGVSAVNYDR
jgi:hypothetical protein